MEESKVRAMIRRGTRKEGGVIGVIDGKNGAEATVGMVLSQWWYSSSWHMEEVWNFVHPDHRHSGHAKHLISFAKWTADKLSVPLIMGILTRDRVAAKIRLYQREIPQVGALFLHGATLTGAINQKGSYKEVRKSVRNGQHKLVSAPAK